MAGLTRAEVERLGRAYIEGVDEAHTPRAQAMARAQADRVEREFRKLQRKIRVQFVDRDPYQTFEQLQADVIGNRRMYVYTGGSDTPLWSPEVNWKSRAVHDYDHVLANTDFSVPGELHAYQYAASRSEGLEPLYLSEIALQAASSEVLGKFLQGPQKLVFPPEDVARIARRFRRNPTRRAASNRQAVWDAAGALRVMSPRQLMRRLGQSGMSFPDSLILVDAAMKLAR